MDQENPSIILGDCLDVMRTLDDKSVDMILCDPPYGTSACSAWDTIIPFEPLWAQYKRIIKTDGAIVLTASQPFTTKLIMSNIEMFKYEMIWVKSRCTGYFDVQYRPMKNHENVLVFGYGGVSNCSNPRMKYTPVGVVPCKPKKRTGKIPDATCRSAVEAKGEQTYTNFPKSVIEFSSETKTVHPTQKPVALFEYLIQMFTNEGDLVLDNCAGSCTTAIAAINTKRKFLCVEKNPEYYAIGLERVNGLR